MKRRNAKLLVSEANNVASEVALAKITRTAASWKKKQKEAVALAIAVEKQLDATLAIKDSAPRSKVTKNRRGKPASVAVIVPATDWHVEERIFSAGTNGKNSFDLAEAERRIKQFYNKIPELIEWQNHLAPVSELWHPLLGDLMTGFLHDDLIETNSLSPTEACVFLQDMICGGIDFLLKETKLPIFLPCSVGNHGRTTQKMRIKTSYRNSYEWLLYMMLAKRYDNNPRVTWDVGQGYHNIQTIVGRKVRFHHGDGLRYQGGVGGLTIPVNKAIAQWNKITSVDLDIFGHWHQFLWHYNDWICCGSLMGFSEYSLSIKANFQHPTQTFIVLDRRYGLTQVIPVFLTKPKRN